MGYLLAALLGGFFLFQSAATPDKAESVMEKMLRERFAGAQVDAEIEGKRGRDVVKGRFKNVRLQMAKFEVESLADAPIFPASTSKGARPAATSTLPTFRAVSKVESRGRIGNLEIDLRDFRYDALRVSQAQLSLREVTFDWDALKKHSQLDVLECGPGQGRLVLQQAALQELLSEQLKEFQDAKVTLRNGRAHLVGRRNIPLIGVGVPFSLSGTLEPRNGNEIWIAKPNLQLSGVAVAAPVTAAFLKSLNPIYVFDPDRKWPFRLMLSNLQIHEGTLELSGALQFVPATK